MAKWHRLLVPVALSLAGHAVILCGIALVPRHEEQPAVHPGEGSTLRLSMSIAGPKRPARVPYQPAGPWIDVTPAVLLPAASTVGEAVPSLAPTLSGTGNENGNGAGAGGPSRPAGSSVVVVPERARRVVFLLDRSGSMALSDALDRAKAELAAALDALPPETAFQLVAYNSNALPLVGDLSDLMPASRENVARVKERLDALTGSGFTRHLDAVREALRLGPDLVVLLTDADDLSTGDVQLMTIANRGRAAIDVVELTRDPLPRPDGGFSSLAASNKGRHRRVLLGR